MIHADGSLFSAALALPATGLRDRSTSGEILTLCFIVGAHAAVVILFADVSATV